MGETRGDPEPDRSAPTRAGQFCRVHYEGPTALLSVLARAFRESGVTLASVCVDGSTRDPCRAAGTEQGERLALNILCRGSLDAVESVVRAFLQGFAPGAALVIAG